jgi:EmrB/QacA subfamily drug resistance transporter
MTTLERPAEAAGEVAPHEDPRRWFTLAIVIMAAFIVVLDNSILYVAIPTILREFHTTLPSLQWVVTGYSLTFATLLLIGGRLGDVFGHRRMFIIGAALFGFGSLIASVSQNVPELIIGEAIVEGIGAALMMPATISIISNTFKGKERAIGFAMWGATAGAAAAFGPVIGGFLTTNYSWRWAFRINVIVAPIAVIGALVFMRRDDHAGRNLSIDIPGALLAGSGVFLLVFGLSQGETYGWLAPHDPFTVGGTTIWPAHWDISIIPFVFALAAILLSTFVVYERAKERRGGSPLFEFSLLGRHKTLRWGLLTSLILAMGMLSLLFVLPVVLQDGKHLSAEQNGFWLLPAGLFIILGAQCSPPLTRRFGTVRVVRAGLIMVAVGILSIALVVSADLTFPELIPGFLLYGMGTGLGMSQLTNVILEHIPQNKAGVVSGSNATARQVGMALGVAVMGALLTAQTIRVASKDIAYTALDSAVKTHALSRIHELGTTFSPPPGASKLDLATLRNILENAVGSGARFALIFATIVTLVGAGVSFLIPRDEPPAPNPTLRQLQGFEPFEPLDVDPTTVEGARHLH